MRIKINNWNEFEKINACYFTRDINIKNEFEVYALFEEKDFFSSKKYLLVYINFYSFQKLLFIKEGKYYDILDASFSQKFITVPKYVSSFQSDDGICHVKMSGLIAKKWMIDDNEFIARAVSLDSEAQKKFESIEFAIKHNF